MVHFPPVSTESTPANNSEPNPLEKDKAQGFQGLFNERVGGQQTSMRQLVGASEYKYCAFRGREEFETEKKKVVELIEREGLMVLFEKHQELIGEFLSRFEWTITEFASKEEPLKDEEIQYCKELLNFLVLTFFKPNEVLMHTLRSSYFQAERELKENYKHIFSHILQINPLDLVGSKQKTPTPFFHIYLSDNVDKISAFAKKYEIFIEPYLWPIGLATILLEQDDVTCR